MTVKIPLNEYGEGNCCPKCGSKKVSIHCQYPLFVKRDINTRKEIITDAEGNSLKISNKLLARIYRQSQSDAQCWHYQCRKCKWTSGMFTQ